jgi:hypothetical protein
MDVTIATDQGDWVRKHLGTIEHSYAEAPHAAEIIPMIRALYQEAASKAHLSQINRLLIEGLQATIGIPTKISWSTDYVTLEESDALTPTDRLVTLCARAGATTYLSGPAAKEYLDTESFSRKNIAVEWMDYSGYRKYPQLHGAFDHHVSVLDLLFMTGSEAAAYLKYARRTLRSESPGGA